MTEVTEMTYVFIVIWILSGIVNFLAFAVEGHVISLILGIVSLIVLICYIKKFSKKGLNNDLEKIKKTD